MAAAAFEVAQISALILMLKGGNTLLAMWAGDNKFVGCCLAHDLNGYVLPVNFNLWVHWLRFVQIYAASVTPRKF